MTHHDDDSHDDFGGLQRDMPQLLGRREALRWMGGMSLAGIIAACSVNQANSTTTGGAATAPTTSTAAATPTTALAATIEASAGPSIPDEAGGPFPADGTNGPNVLTEDGVLKSDLTTSFGTLSGTATGLPLAFQLTVVDSANGTPLPASVMYLWHCTADGRYSIYETSDQNYLRGVQVADGAGRITFTSVFPGCYPGRWPHAHFEIYESLDKASRGSAAIKTSQLALPRADCEAVYADSRYGNSFDNLSKLSLDTDVVFRDGWTDQLATVGGSIDNGLSASLLVRV